MPAPDDDFVEPLPPGGEPLAPGVFVPRELLRFAFSRSSGPGGQNVNKRSTKAELRVRLAELRPHLRGDVLARLADQTRGFTTDDGELLIVCDENRSQGRNRDGCLARLRAMIVGAMVVPKVRRKTKPSRGSKERRLASKKARSEVKARRRGAE